MSFRTSQRSFSRTTDVRRLALKCGKLAEQLVQGTKTVEDVDERDLKGILINLGVLRCESNAFNDMERVDTIGKLVRQVNSRLKMPRAKQAVSEFGSPQRHERREEKSRLSSEEIDRIIQDLENGEIVDIEGEDEKVQVVRQIRKLNETFLNERRYDKVEQFDEILKDLKNKSIALDSLKTKKSKRARKVRYWMNEKKRLEAAKETMIEEIERLKQQHLDNLTGRMIEIAQLRDKIPAEDDPLYAKRSKAYWELRQKGQSLAEARDFDQAASLQEQADILDQMEHDQKMDERIQAIARCEQQIRNAQQKAIDCCEMRWQEKLDTTAAVYDRNIEFAQSMIDRTRRS